MDDNFDFKQIEHLISQLESEDWEVSDKSFDALVELGPKAVEPLLNVISTQPVEIRTLLVSILGKIGDEKALKPLLSMLKDDAFEVRAEIAYVLGWLIIDKKNIEPLIEILLNDKEAEVREAAADALGNLGDERAIPYLEQIASNDKGMSEHSSVEIEALNALRHIRNKFV